MPPRTRRPAAEPAEKPEPRHAKADGEICPECWPEGWRTDDTSAASCIHGTWTR